MKEDFDRKMKPFLIALFTLPLLCIALLYLIFYIQTRPIILQTETTVITEEDQAVKKILDSKFLEGIDLSLISHIKIYTESNRGSFFPGEKYYIQFTVKKNDYHEMVMQWQNTEGAISPAANEMGMPIKRTTDENPPDWWEYSGPKSLLIRRKAVFTPEYSVYTNKEQSAFYIRHLRVD